MLVTLVLATIAHAGDSHQHSDFVVDEHGTASVIKLSRLYPWPGADLSDGGRSALRVTRCSGSLEHRRL